MPRRSLAHSQPPVTRTLGSAALFFAALTLVGCPESVKTKPRACTGAFEQCQLPEGPLGVCQETSCAEGKVAPCYRCVSQH